MGYEIRKQLSPAWLAPAIGAAVSGIGMAIASGKDKRQLRQQEKLQNLQIRGNKEMMDYSMQKEMEMWENTSYDDQVRKLKEAGLNPGLMYGMGGGGGQSTGSPTGNVNGGQAPSGSGREFEEMAGMGIQVASQVALMKAQKENIEADTANKLGDAANKPKVGANIEADTILKGAQTTIQGLEAKYRGESMEDALMKISGEAVQAVQKGQQEVNNTSISDQTKQDTVKRMKAEAVGAVLQNAISRAQEKNIKAGTEKTGTESSLNRQTLGQNVQKLMLEWREMSIKERKSELEWMIGVGNDDALQKTMNTVADAIDNILYMRSGGKPDIGTKPPSVTGFGGKR